VVSSTAAARPRAWVNDSNAQRPKALKALKARTLSLQTTARAVVLLLFFIFIKKSRIWFAWA
jgi:hypothetical protein